MSDPMPTEARHCEGCDGFRCHLLPHDPDLPAWQHDKCPGIAPDAPAEPRPWDIAVADGDVIGYILRESLELLTYWRVDQPRQIPLVQRTQQLEAAIRQVQATRMAHADAPDGAVSVPRTLLREITAEMREAHDYPRSADQREECDGCGWCEGGGLIEKLRALGGGERG